MFSELRQVYFAQLPVNHPALQVIATMPEETTPASFAPIFPIILRLIRTPSQGGVP